MSMLGDIFLGIITTILSGWCLHYLTRGRSKCMLDSNPTPTVSPRQRAAVYQEFAPPTAIMGVKS